MAEQAPEIQGKGTPAEQELYGELRWHYWLAYQDHLKRRFYFDRADELYRTFVDKSNWPYKAVVALPLAFQMLTEKTSRLIANKLRGKVYPRTDGDVVKAKITNEVLSYQWDAARDAGTMIQKWAMMDHLTRKYGSAFGVVYWKTQKKLVKSSGSQGGLTGELKKPVFENKVIFDGPEFKVIPARDVLPNPSYTDIKGWFQYREWLTMEELEGMRTGDPRYSLKNLDMLRESINRLAAGRSDSRSTAYVIKNKSLRGIIDYMGQDKYYPITEVVTELRPDRWIKFAPRHGIILQDIPNPLENGEIPIVHLRYYPVEDDLYGLSEIEPVEKLLRATNAMVSQYLDTINTELYPPLMINPRNVQMHTIEFGPNKKWLMNTPGVDVQRMEMKTQQSIAAFSSSYSFMLSAVQGAFGESSAPTSNITPFNPDKTATEVKDFAMQRLSRDNYNQIMLGEAIKRQMMLWLEQNKKWLPKTFPLRITDRQILQQLTRAYTQDGRTQLPMGISTPDGQPNMQPISPVKYKGEVRNKFELDGFKETGVLLVEKEDLDGEMEYIPDVTSMSMQVHDRDTESSRELLQMILQPEIYQLLVAEGVVPKVKDLIVEIFDDEGYKEGDRFFGTPNDQHKQIAQQAQGGPEKTPQPAKQPSESLNYKDAPPDIKRQIEAQAGLNPSQQPPQPEAQRPPVQVPFEQLPEEGKSQAAAMSGMQIPPERFAQHEAKQKAMEIAEQAQKGFNAAPTGR